MSQSLQLTQSLLSAPKQLLIASAVPGQGTAAPIFNVSALASNTTFTATSMIDYILFNNTGASKTITLNLNVSTDKNGLAEIVQGNIFQLVQQGKQGNFKNQLLFAGGFPGASLNDLKFDNNVTYTLDDQDAIFFIVQQQVPTPTNSTISFELIPPPTCACPNPFSKTSCPAPQQCNTQPYHIVIGILVLLLLVAGGFILNK